MGQTIRYPSRATYTVVSALGYMLDGYDLSVISVFTFSLIHYKFFQYNSFELAFVTGAALLGGHVRRIDIRPLLRQAGEEVPIHVRPAVLRHIRRAERGFHQHNTNDNLQILRGLGGSWGGGLRVEPPSTPPRCTPTNKRGGMGYGWVYTFWSVGAFIAFMLGGYAFYLADPVYGWRWALGIGAVIALITIIVRTRMPESSRWKVAVKPDEKSVEEAKALSHATGMGDDDISKLVDTETRKLSSVKPGSFLELFRGGKFAIRTLVVWVQWILYDVGSYGFGLYAPSIISMLGFTGAHQY